VTNFKKISVYMCIKFTICEFENLKTISSIPHVVNLMQKWAIFLYVDVHVLDICELINVFSNPNFLVFNGNGEENLCEILVPRTEMKHAIKYKYLQVHM